MRALAILAASTLLVTGFAQSASAAPADPVLITVKGSDVDAAALNVNGLTYKGFGILSANSTSALLLDYKAQQPEKYWELLETLYGGDYPIMNTIKIEMGNDRNTSTGPNPASMRTRDEYPNVQREPGFQLAADAELVAHGDVHLSLLRWNRPGWVTTDESQYIWFKNTVLAAYREYGVMVDSINPDTNETGNPDVALYKKFTNWLRNDTHGYEGATSGDPNNGFASADEKELYQSIRTVAADTVGTPPVSFGNLMTSTSDSTLRDAVDVVGFHYSTSDDSAGNLKKLAVQFDKEIWNSEGQATFSNSADRPNNTNNNGQGGVGTEFGGGNGPLEMSNWITSGFEKSHRTLNIFQPAIGSFYDGLQYSSKELVSAREPWSGWLYYDGGLAAIEQYSQFAKLGWENSTNTAGIWRGIPQASKTDVGGGNPPSGAQNGGYSYTTLAAPDKSDFSTVIVNDSAFVKTYKITATDLDLSSDTMEVWETRAADAGEAYNANWMVPVEEVTADQSGTYTITVSPWSTATATTLDHAQEVGGTLVARDGFGSALPTSPEYSAADGGRDVLDTDVTGDTNGVTTDTVLYSDDFDYSATPNIQSYDPTTGALTASTETFLDSRGTKAPPTGTPNVQSEDRGAIPRYTNDINGAFESVATVDANHGRVLRQQVGPGMAGSAWNGGDPKTTLGDYRWANYRVSVDVMFESTSGAYATVGARSQGGTSNGQSVSAAELRVDPTGAWTLMRFGSTLASGRASDVAGTNFQAGAGGWNTLAVQVAGARYTAYINGVEIGGYTDPAPQATGRIQLGSAFTFTQFDNLKIEQLAGYTPYYTQLIDGMHQTSWANVSEPVLEFNNKWSHVNGQGMFEWQRTASKSTGAGAAMTYTFTGTGLDIVGTNSGNAKLNVTVDGVRIASGAPTWPAGSERTTFTLRGLSNEKHTVVIETATADEINIDAVGVVLANADSSAVNTASLAAAVTAAEELAEEEFSADSWAVFANALSAAEDAVSDPNAFGLDVEGAAAIESRLAAATAQLVPKDVSVDVRDIGLLSAAKADGLPATVALDGTTPAVVWDTGAAQTFAATAETAVVQLTGRTTQKQESGFYQRFTAAVLVTPGTLKYFIDSGSTNSGEGSVYSAVAASQPGLLNTVTDQKWNGTDGTATWGWSSTSTGATPAGSASDWQSSYLSADFNKPIVYNVTLPAGSYNLVAVQAPRTGLTTQFYSSVVAGSYTNRTNATSTGGATSVTQQVTLSAPGVVKLEFGTNGTSGYNGRLALVYVQAIPRDVGFQGALTIKADLPETVTIDGNAVAVAWDVDAAAQVRKTYEPISIKGTVGEGSNAQRISARYEIVPQQLVYYIDSGTNGVDSPQYVAVKNSGAELLNDKVDQVSASADQWGYDAAGMVLKSSTDVNNKYSTGMYQNTTVATYRLPLEAGTYTLTGGFTEWWNVSRTMNHTVSVAGEELAKGNVPLSGTSTPLSADLTFTLAEAATVEYRITNEGAGSEKPVISWVAVAEQVDKTALVEAIAAAEALSEGDYTASSWSALGESLAVARAVVADPAATPQEIASATTALTQAQSSLVSLVVLKATVELAGSLIETDYDAETWAPFAEAKAAAEAVLADPSATREQVDAATLELLAAQQALAPAPEVVDTTVLEAALAVANGLVETNYTASSWAAFVEARDAASALIAPPADARIDGATQADVDQAIADLLAAQGGLVSIAALAAAVDTSAALVEDDYTPETWTVFAEALMGAKVVLADADATAGEVDAALTALSGALDQLKEFVYTDTLSALIASAEKLIESNYTPESWAPFAQALAAAKAVLAEANATQAQVEEASAALIAARDGLVEVAVTPEPEPEDVDRTALQAAIDSATPLVQAAYTPESWAPFALALETAQAVLVDEEATQAEVDAATTGLITAQGALVPVDPTVTVPPTDTGGTGEEPADPTQTVLSATGVDASVAGALALILLLAGGLVMIVRRRAARD